MAYVNQHTSPPTQPPGKPNPVAEFSRNLLRHLPHTRVRAWLALSLAAFLAILVALLALSPTYTGLASFDLQPMRLLDPLRTYLFRNAVLNTGWLLLGVYPLALGLGWTWAVTGIVRWIRPFLLLPLFIPGALIGLLWRPLFSGWLTIAHAELSLLATALIFLWIATPLAAWHFSLNRPAWLKLLPLCALLIFLDGDLVLTFSRGEPFNATHTWASWIVQQLWTTRAWGYAASMAGALALLLALLTTWASQPTASPKPIPYGSPLGLVVAIVWLIGPFALPLWDFVQAPRAAFATLANLGALLWVINGLLLWGGTTLLAYRFAWRVPSAHTRRLVRILTVAIVPIGTVAFAYLAYIIPILRSQWLLIILTTLLTAGLLMSDDNMPAQRRHQWLKAAGYALLVIVHTFPLQLVLQFPTLAWTPALGIVWTLTEAPHSTAALGAALLFYGVGAGVGSYMVQNRDSI